MKEQNLDTYNKENVIQWYLKLDYLVPAERKVFSLYKNLITQGKLLDIGVGGGRTTGFLIKLCCNYTGIDYSEKFIQALKVKIRYTANVLRVFLCVLDTYTLGH